MPKQQSNAHEFICPSCGTVNLIPRSLAKRYFEGYKPSIPMYMNSNQRQRKPQTPPVCRGCGKSLI